MSYEVYALNPPPRRGSGISPYTLNPFATPSQAMAAAYKRFGTYKPKSKKAKAIWAKKSKAKKRKPAKNPAKAKRPLAARPLFGFRPFVPSRSTLFPARNAPMGSTLGIAPSPRWSKPKAKKARSTNMSLKRNAKGRYRSIPALPASRSHRALVGQRIQRLLEQASVNGDGGHASPLCIFIRFTVTLSASTITRGDPWASSSS